VTRVAALLLAVLLGAATPAATLDDLGWLAGDWTQESDGRWTEESWTAPRGGVMLGHSRSGRGEAVREWEFLRLQADSAGRLAYIAQPGGKAPVRFALVDHGPARAIFENADHDYPQRIAYVRDGDRLTATISLIDGTRAISWTYKRR
jgi:hypothetical protein